MKNILGRVYALWVAIVFSITMLLVLIPIWVTGFGPEPRRTALLIGIAKHWMTVFFFLAGIRDKIKGKENFKKGCNYIIVCNHNSLMDVPLTSGRIPGANKTIAKIEMAKIPLFGIIYKRGSVLVNRKDPNSSKDSFNRMKQVLEQGMHMCIYPEGTRNKTDNPLKEFHDGAFRLATGTLKPIMPTVIFGTRRMLPNDKPFFFWPGKVEMHFLEPFEVKETDTAEELKEKTFRIMWEYIEKNDPFGK